MVRSAIDYRFLSLVLILSTIDRIFSFESTKRIGLAPHDRPTCQLTRRAHPNYTAISSIDQNQRAPNNLLGTPVELNQLFKTNQDTGAVLKNSNDNEPQMSKSSKFDSSDRLRKLRQIMSADGFDAYLATSEDEHGSEYTSQQDKRLKFISGFTGSRGFALILMDRAVFITDGRYSLQAEQELDCNWWVISTTGSLSNLIQWLKENTAKGMRIAVNARLISLQEYEMLESGVNAIDSQLILLSQDLVDRVWNDMPGQKLPHSAPILVHPPRFAGGSNWQQKLLRLSDQMSKLQLNNYVITALDEIAWLFNLRGADIPFSPLFKAFAFISKVQPQHPIQQQVVPIHLSGASSNNLLPEIDNNNNRPALHQHNQSGQTLSIQTKQVIKVTLYTDLTRITTALRDYLGVDNSTIALRTITDGATGLFQRSSTQIIVDLVDYDLFVNDISQKFSTPGKVNGRLAIPIRSNVAVHTVAKNYQDRIILMESLIVSMKKVKSDGEVNNMRLAHARDSLAISMLLAQLEYDIQSAEYQSTSNKWNEISAANQLTLYRSLMEYNRGLSFGTISAFGSNGAIVHYQPSEATCKTIDNSSMYLLDSGGQYLDGTTDITRTTHYGQPTFLQKETYTRVLMGSIDIMALLFPGGGADNSDAPHKISDILARRHLFEIGLDYHHGTGHGIGAYSLVHEAPNIIVDYRSESSLKSPTTQSGVPIYYQSQPIQANMMTSVEPGYYKANDFGIRLENIVVVKSINDKLFKQYHNSNEYKLSNSTRSQQEQTINNSSKLSSSLSNESHYLGFEPLSLVPFEPKLIKYQLLGERHISWLNDYNKLIRQRLIGLIKQYMNKLDGSMQTTATTVSTSTKKRFRALLNDDGASSDHSLMSNKKEDNIHSSNSYLGLIDKEQFRQALQRAHLWILSKTEPIQLSSRSANINGDEGSDSMINSPLAYSGGQSIDASGQHDISNYKCNDTANSKSCGLFMMAVNRFQSNSSNGAVSQLSPYSNYTILLCIVVAIQITIMIGLNRLYVTAN